MTKLILEEDELLDFETNAEEVEEASETSAVTSTIADLIKKVWDMIDSINGASVSLAATGNESITDNLSEIIQDEYIHIGQLEKILNNMVPEADAIETGEQKAEETISEPVEEVPVEEPVEAELPPDDIE